jgi:hypothetical protein
VGSEQLYDFLDLLIADAVDALDDFAIPVPSRQFVSVGEPAEDCETIAAWINLLGPWASPPRNDRGNCGFVTTVTVNLRIVTCVTEGDNHGNPLTAEQLDELGRLHYKRGWVLWDQLLKRWLDASGAFTGRKCDTFRNWQMLQATPFGGSAGWTISFEMQMGNEPPLAS